MRCEIARRRLCSFYYEQRTEQKGGRFGRVSSRTDAREVQRRANSPRGELASRAMGLALAIRRVLASDQRRRCRRWPTRRALTSAALAALVTVER
jgi:hypothetical protein